MFFPLNFHHGNTQREKIMSKIEKQKIMKKMIMTKHFLKRYSERVLRSDDCEQSYLGTHVYSDMTTRISDREANFVQLFGSNKNVKLPFDKIYQIVISKNIFITIY